ncbi:hypothetical protein [Methylomonas sp. AM2-LC]|uniref:hypothetical protein n=1 Tax=Methylomonas sp. AM2-LC TaxID=3153301 RepID=UPI003267BCAC
MNIAKLYFGLASSIVIFIVSLPWLMRYFVPGTEMLILIVGSLLLAFATVAILSMLSQSARQFIKSNKAKYLIYLSVFISVLYSAFAVLLIIYPLDI